MAELISHIYQDNVGHWIIQSNEEHSVGVAKLASRFGGEFGMSEWGKVLGQLHDKGKESHAFQQHIKKESGYEPDIKVCGNYNHAFIGGVFARRLYGKSADVFFVNQIVSHHTGLHDYDEIEGILNQDIPADIIRKTKCYRFTKRNVPKHKTKRLRYRCPPEPYSNSVRTDFFSYSNAIILESQQINTSI